MDGFQLWRRDGTTSREFKTRNHVMPMLQNEQWVLNPSPTMPCQSYIHRNTSLSTSDRSGNRWYAPAQIFDRGRDWALDNINSTILAGLTQICFGVLMLMPNWMAGGNIRFSEYILVFAIMSQYLRQWTKGYYCRDEQTHAILYECSSWSHNMLVDCSEWYLTHQRWRWKITNTIYGNCGNPGDA